MPIEPFTTCSFDYAKKLTKNVLIFSGPNISVSPGFWVAAYEFRSEICRSCRVFKKIEGKNVFGKNF